MSPRALAIVPARLGSTRLPRKMLLRETGRYLFEHTVRNAERATSLERVLLAIDDAELEAAAREVGIAAVMTSVDHQSGTDRVLEALEAHVAGGGTEPEVVVNVQGDEPDLDPSDIDRLVEAFDAPEVTFATLWVPLDDPSAFERPEVVKLVTDEAGRVLYFSRAPIPARGHGSEAMRAQRHLGVYAYRPDALRTFCARPVSSLERRERLEQLRWLESGGTIHALRAAHAPRGIDTPDDYRAFVGRCAARVDQDAVSDTQ
ncbi:MAG: 3-deoxy-manno-octulosonate cytidylyltransferase [Planctomycetota bacterium]